MGTIGPLMQTVLGRIDEASAAEASSMMATLSAEDHGEEVPAVIQAEPERPHEGESWEEYAARTRERLRPLQERLAAVFGVESEILVAANAVKARPRPDQVTVIADQPQVSTIELDPLLRVTLMDDAVMDVELPAFQGNHPGVDGRGVRVAVLDSGIDLHHPFLRVTDSVSTCGETDQLPGDHGTHCAGSIASRDSIFPGMAPGVDLINVKVLFADGRGQSTHITRGIDEALARGAQVLSLSLGFNHLPHWSDQGHGWFCPDGRCSLCVAIDTAVAFDGVVAVVAAGNEHLRAETLRNFGFGSQIDTELGCPGNAHGAITVGALTKQTFLPAGFSSRGPTSYGLSKPDLSAPGVNVTSTVPVPRDAQQQPIPAPPRAMLFDRKSGTSMATPIVAGAAALLIQIEQDAGRPWTPASLRQLLLHNATSPLGVPPNLAGAGRLVLGAI